MQQTCDFVKVNHPFLIVIAAMLQFWPPRDSTEEARGLVPCSKATWKLLRFLHQHNVSVKRAEDLTRVIIWGLSGWWTVKGTSSADPRGGSVMPFGTNGLLTEGNHLTVKYLSSNVYRERHFFTLALNVSLTPGLCLMAHTAYCWNCPGQHPGEERHVYCV